MAMVNESRSEPTRQTIARCLEIARECLQKDPFREVPVLELQLDRIALEIQGRKLTPTMIEEAKGTNLPAYAIAEHALQLVSELSEASR